MCVCANARACEGGTKLDVYALHALSVFFYLPKVEASFYRLRTLAILNGWVMVIHCLHSPGLKCQRSRLHTSQLGLVQFEREWEKGSHSYTFVTLKIVIHYKLISKPQNSQCRTKLSYTLEYIFINFSFTFLIIIKGEFVTLNRKP